MGKNVYCGKRFRRYARIDRPPRGTRGNGEDKIMLLFSRRMIENKT